MDILSHMIFIIHYFIISDHDATVEAAVVISLLWKTTGGAGELQFPEVHPPDLNHILDITC